MRNKKILITGGAGFIGSNIVQSLLEDQFEVTVYDNFSFGLMENLKPFEKDIRIIEGDILNQQLLTKSIKGHDIVSHQAAQLEIILGEENPYADLETNTIGTLNVLKAVRENDIELLINASSACIYGQTQKACGEDFLPNPNWAYGVSKLAADKYAGIYREHYGIPIFNLRYGITYGPNEWYRRVLTIFLKRFLQQEPLIIFGEGEQVRDFVFVEDAVRLHNACLKHPAQAGDYNCGNTVKVSVKDLAEAVVKVGQELYQYSVDIIYEDIKPGKKSTLVSDKIRNPSELQMMLLDCEKAKTNLGWQPQVSIEDGIAQQFRWLEKNMHRWNVIQYSH